MLLEESLDLAAIEPTVFGQSLLIFVIFKLTAARARID